MLTEFENLFTFLAHLISVAFTAAVFSIFSPTGTITSSLGSTINVGSSTVITLNAAAGAGDTLLRTGIVQNVSGGPLISDANEATSPISYIFSTVVPGAYKFQGYVKTKAYSSAWYPLSGALMWITVVSPSTSTSPTLSATPTSGSAPLSVYFRSSIGGTITFGDGQTGTLKKELPPPCAPGSSCGPFYDISHTYTSVNTYTASLGALTPACSGGACNAPARVTITTTSIAKLGAYAYSQPQDETKFSNWLGRPVSVAIDYLWSSSTQKTWSGLVTNASTKSLLWSTQAPSYQIAYGVPMLPSDGVSTLALGASGAYDSYFKQVAQILVANGESNAILRIGWELNGNWYLWAAQNDPKDFVTYWRRIVTVMRSVPGEHFTFDWNLSANWDVTFDPSTVYPGNDVVDEIGIDFYDTVTSTPFGSANLPQRWTTLSTSGYGIDWISRFATQQGKPMAFDEWGVGCSEAKNASTGCTATSNGGDDPYFINQMHSWIQTHNVAWQSYFDATVPSSGGYHSISSGEFPLSAAAYIADFGRN